MIDLHFKGIDHPGDDLASLELFQRHAVLGAELAIGHLLACQATAQLRFGQASDFGL